MISARCGPLDLFNVDITARANRVDDFSSASGPTRSSQRHTVSLAQLSIPAPAERTYELNRRNEPPAGQRKGGPLIREQRGLPRGNLEVAHKSGAVLIE